jgi:hypothetical protein
MEDGVEGRMEGGVKERMEQRVGKYGVRSVKKDEGRSGEKN